MPIKPVDYSKTHFYKIVCKDLRIADCYVGHTTNFKNRKRQHKSTCSNENNKGRFEMYLYDFIRQNGGWDNFQMVLIETRECENNLHARQLERQHMEALNATLNKLSPIRSREEKLQYFHERYDQNKEEFRRKAEMYRMEKPEKIKERKKRDYQLHKDKYTEYRKDHTYKITCKCGAVFNNTGKSCHERTKKHQEYLNNQSAEAHTEEFLQTTQDN